MTHSNHPPEGWFPDPADHSQLRYWSGAEWTEHVAPYPVAQPAVHPAQARPSVWTRQTIIVLCVCIALVIGSIGGAVWLHVAELGKNKSSAETVLDDFLAAATVGDESWRDFASESLNQKVPVGAPIRGEENTAEALELSVDYEVQDLTLETTEFRGRDNRADSAHADVIFTYTFTFDGEARTTDAKQRVWLTRPFYFGDEKPQISGADGRPSAVAPWRVTSLTFPTTSSFAEENTDILFHTDLNAEFKQYEDENICYEGALVMEEISKEARTEGAILTSCLIDSESGALVDESLDLDLAAATFPVFNPASTSSRLPVPELTRQVGYFTQHPAPPFQQYLVETAAGKLVFTVALVDVGESGFLGHGTSTRLISVQLAEEKDD